MSQDPPPEPPKFAKAHSDFIRDLYVAAGWTVASTFKDDKGNAYEYLLAWNKDGEPVRPELPANRRDRGAT